MKARKSAVRWSFRTKLAVTIASVFIVAGLGLMTVQYLLVTGLFGQAVATSTDRVIQNVMCTDAQLLDAGSDAGIAIGGDTTADTQTGTGSASGTDAPPAELVSSCTIAVNDGAPVAGTLPGDTRIMVAQAIPADGSVPGVGTGTDAGAALTAVAGGGPAQGTALSATDPSASPTGGPADSGPQTSMAGVAAAGAVGIWYEAQSTELADDVLTRMLVLSGVVLVGFAVIAAGIAWWLARRSLKRIGEVTAMAKDLSTEDLHRRIELPGARDEIKELADTIDEMLDRLESAFAAQDRFVANASHELRTPLTISRTALEIPLSQGRVPVDLQPAVQTALRAGEQSDRLIASLLTLARRDEIAVAVSVDVAEIADEVIDALAEPLASADLTLDRTLSRTVVVADQTMLVQGVTNLLDNAIRHNIDGGRIWLTVRQSQPGTTAIHRSAENLSADRSSRANHIDDPAAGVVITVENTGRIIDPGDIDLLTEPFYRGDDSRTAVPATKTRPGTGVGLGLSIVASINQAHHGRLRITARDGGGLRVEWWIPAEHSAEQQDEISPES